MQFERVDDRDALLRERGRLEDVLQSCEEWRALLQLKARLVRGGYRPSVHATRLEKSLLSTLETNADFQRYRAVVIAMSQLPELLPDLPAVRSASAVMPAPEEPAVPEDELLAVEPLVFLPTPLVPPARRIPPPIPNSHMAPPPATPSPRAMFSKLAEPGDPGAVRVRRENSRGEIGCPGSMSVLQALPPPLSGTPAARLAGGRGSTPAGRFLKALTGY